jgi:hypothetical protein
MRRIAGALPLDLVASNAFAFMLWLRLCHGIGIAAPDALAPWARAEPDLARARIMEFAGLSRVTHAAIVRRGVVRTERTVRAPRWSDPDLAWRGLLGAELRPDDRVLLLPRVDLARAVLMAGATLVRHAPGCRLVLPAVLQEEGVTVMIGAAPDEPLDHDRHDLSALRQVTGVPASPWS